MKEIKELKVDGVMSVTNINVYGLEESIKASGYPMLSELNNNELCDNDYKRAKKLGNAKPGSGHDCYLKGILLQFDLQVPEYIWRQLDRYHFIDFVSSQSKMHRITKMDLDKICNMYVSENVINELNGYINEYNNFEYSDTAVLKLRNNIHVPRTKENIFRTIIANTPSGVMLTARMTTNYLQLKSMINQRSSHKMHEWRLLTDWMSELPMVRELILNDK